MSSAPPSHSDARFGFLLFPLTWAGRRRPPERGVFKVDQVGKLDQCSFRSCPGQGIGNVKPIGGQALPRRSFVQWATLEKWTSLGRQRAIQL